MLLVILPWWLFAVIVFRLIVLLIVVSLFVFALAAFSFFAIFVITPALLLASGFRLLIPRLILPVVPLRVRAILLVVVPVLFLLVASASLPVVVGVGSRVIDNFSLLALVSFHFLDAIVVLDLVFHFLIFQALVDVLASHVLLSLGPVVPVTSTMVTAASPFSSNFVRVILLLGSLFLILGIVFIGHIWIVPFLINTPFIFVASSLIEVSLTAWLAIIIFVLVVFLLFGLLRFLLL